MKLCTMLLFLLYSNLASIWRVFGHGEETGIDRHKRALCYQQITLTSFLIITPNQVENNFFSLLHKDNSL